MRGAITRWCLSNCFSSLHFGGRAYMGGECGRSKWRQENSGSSFYRGTRLGEEVQVLGLAAQVLDRALLVLSRQAAGGKAASHDSQVAESSLVTSSDVARAYHSDGEGS